MNNMKSRGGKIFVVWNLEFLKKTKCKIIIRIRTTFLYTYSSVCQFFIHNLDIYLDNDCEC